MERWPVSTLGEACLLIGGGTPSKRNSAYYGGPIRWATVRDMNTDVIEETDCRITERAVRASSTNVIPAGCVVIATRVGLGKVCLLANDTAINQDLRGVVPKPGVSLNSRYLFYWFMTMAPRIIEEGTGATVQGVKVGFVKSLRIPLPPLPKQERIVAILDEAFAAIATATANAEKNLANARELGPAIFLEILSSSGDGWSTTTIGEQVLLQRGFDITKKQQVPGPVPVVSSGGIKSYHAKAMVAGPGVVIGRKGSIGQVHFVAEDYWPHDTTLWIKDFMGNNPRFVYHFFKTMDLAKLDSGAANPALNRNMIHPLTASWPSAELQEEIVRRTDTAESLAQSLESKYTDKHRSLSQLKQSILHKAFTGELTTDSKAADRTLSEAGL